MNVLARVITERPVPPAQRRPEFDIDPGLERICMRALRKNVEGRFQTAGEFRAALHEVLEQPTREAPKPAPAVEERPERISEHDLAPLRRATRAPPEVATPLPPLKRSQGV